MQLVFGHVCGVAQRGPPRRSMPEGLTFVQIQTLIPTPKKRRDTGQDTTGTSRDTNGATSGATSGATVGTPPKQKPGHLQGHRQDTDGSSRDPRWDTTGTTEGDRRNKTRIRRKPRRPRTKRATSHAQHARYEHGRRLPGWAHPERTHSTDRADCVMHAATFRCSCTLPIKFEHNKGTSILNIYVQHSKQHNDKQHNGNIEVPEASM